MVQGLGFVDTVVYVRVFYIDIHIHTHTFQMY